MNLDGDTPRGAHRARSWLPSVRSPVIRDDYRTFQPEVAERTLWVESGAPRLKSMIYEISIRSQHPDSRTRRLTGDGIRPARRCQRLYAAGGRASASRRALAEDALQGAAVHLEAAGGLRDVPLAQLEDPLDVLPAH